MLVIEAEILREEQTPAQTEEVNCAPRSEVRTTGTPNLESHVERKAQDWADMEANRVTSSQRVVQSIMVRR